MRYHLTQVRMVMIKKSTNNKCWRVCGEKGTPLHCWRECKLVPPLWRTVWRFLRKLKIRVAVWSSNPTPGHISGQNSNPKRYMHPKVHSSTIYNSQDIEANYMFIHRWVNEEMWYVVHMCVCVCVCVYAYTMEYHSAIKRKKNTATWSKRYYCTKQSKSERYDIT